MNCKRERKIAIIKSLLCDFSQMLDKSDKDQYEAVMDQIDAYYNVFGTINGFHKEAEENDYGKGFVALLEVVWYEMDSFMIFVVPDYDNNDKRIVALNYLQKDAEENIEEAYLLDIWAHDCGGNWIYNVLKQSLEKLENGEDLIELEKLEEIL